MSAVLVFCGPTLAGVELPSTIRRLPPAGLGDMRAAAPSKPATLVLIDGLFGRQRSPWHKEILTLMAAGHRIVGAASMGALRACELKDFGMVGVGLVYRAYRRGVLVDDGDVAIAHAPAQLGWRPLSIALVDMLVTLSRMRQSGAIDPTTACSLARRARALPFGERSWAAVLGDQYVSDVLRERLISAASAKRADALQAVAFALAATPWPPPPLPPPSTRWENLLA